MKFAGTLMIKEIILNEFVQTQHDKYPLFSLISEGQLLSFSLCATNEKSQRLGT